MLWSLFLFPLYLQFYFSIYFVFLIYYLITTLLLSAFGKFLLVWGLHFFLGYFLVLFYYCFHDSIPFPCILGQFGPDFLLTFFCSIRKLCSGFHTMIWGLGILCCGGQREELSWGSIFWYLSFDLTSRLSSNVWHVRVLFSESENSPISMEILPGTLGWPLTPQSVLLRGSLEMGGMGTWLQLVPGTQVYVCKSSHHSLVVGGDFCCGCC